MVKMVNVMVAIIALLAAVVYRTEADGYVVGDELGCILPDGASTYVEWASEHVLLVIKVDTIFFGFEEGEQDVALVTKQDFHSCNTNNLIWHSPAPVTLSFLIEATYYLIGSLPGHCDAGQKIALHWSKPRSSANATAASSASAEVNSDALPLKVVAKRV